MSLDPRVVVSQVQQQSSSSPISQVSQSSPQQEASSPISSMSRSLPSSSSSRTSVDYRMLNVMGSRQLREQGSEFSSRYGDRRSYKGLSSLPEDSRLVYNYVKSRGGTVTEISQETGLGTPQVTNIVDNLVKLGLLKKE